MNHPTISQLVARVYAESYHCHDFACVISAKTHLDPQLAVKLAEYARRLHATALEIQNHATGNPAPAPAP